MHFYLRHTFLLLLSVILLATACSDDDGPLLTPPAPGEKKVYLLFSPNGLGDMSFNDRILSAASTFVLEQENMSIDYLSPADYAEGEEFFLQWLNTATSKDSTIMVLPDHAYEAFVEKHKNLIDPARHCILLPDSRRDDLPAHTLYISYYGACYWAGLLQTSTFGEEYQTAILKANNQNIVLNEMEDGFAQGVTDGGSRIAHTWVLDPEGTGGYDQVQEAYELAAQLPEANVTTLFAIAGGSNMGIYRFTREFPGSFLVPGIDVDQSGISPDVPFSLLKHIDRLLAEHLKLWAEGEPQPASPHIVGLAEGYTDLVISERYKELYPDYVQYKDIAIQKEAAYERTE